MTPKELLDQYDIKAENFFALSLDRAELAYLLIQKIMEQYGTYMQKETLLDMKKDIEDMFKSTNIHIPDSYKLDTKI